MIKLTLNSSLQKRRTDEEGEEEAAFRFPRNKVPRGRKSTMRLGRNFQAVSFRTRASGQDRKLLPIEGKIVNNRPAELVATTQYYRHSDRFLNQLAEKIVKESSA